MIIDLTVCRTAVVVGALLSMIWPYVIEKIEKSPLVGYGRLAMKRTGLEYRLREELDEIFPHPHNIYLEWLLDNGIIGFIPVMIFFATVVLYSARLFRHGPDPWYVVIGGISLSLVLAQLIAGLGSQHFYPREGTLGMWCAIFLMFRVYLAYRKSPAVIPAAHYAPMSFRPMGRGVSWQN